MKKDIENNVNKEKNEKFIFQQENLKKLGIVIDKDYVLGVKGRRYVIRI